MDKPHNIYLIPPPKEMEEMYSWHEKFQEYFTLLFQRIIKQDTKIILLGSKNSSLDPEGFYFVYLSQDLLENESYKALIDKACKEIKDTNTRIYKILTSPVVKDELHPFLQDQLNYNFFEINRFNKKAKAYLLTEELPQPKTWSKLVDLVYDIKAEISGSKENEKIERQNPYIYLAGTTFDQQENLDTIRRELQHLGYKFLPRKPLPNNGEELKAAMLEDLSKCFMSIHLMGAFLGETLKKTQHSLLDFQNLVVKEYIESLDTSKDEFIRLVWMPNDLKISDQRQGLYLRRFKRDENYDHTEIIEAPLEEFKTIFHEKIESLNVKKEDVKESSGSVYMIFEKENLKEVENLIEFLEYNKLKVIKPDFESRINIVTDHKKKLVKADAAIIMQGTSSKEWVNNKLRDFIKAPGYSREKPFKALCVITDYKIDNLLSRWLPNLMMFDKKNVDYDKMFAKFLDKIA